MKLFKKVRKLANNYNKEMVAMNTSLEEVCQLTVHISTKNISILNFKVEKGLEVTTRHLYNTDTFTLVDADFTGTQCGPFVSALFTLTCIQIQIHYKLNIFIQDLTSWSENYDIYLAAGSNGVSSDTTFNGGTWTSK